MPTCRALRFLKGAKLSWLMSCQTGPTVWKFGNYCFFFQYSVLKSVFQEPVLIVTEFCGRHAEMARAVVRERLAGRWLNVHYIGILKAGSQKDVLAGIEESVYNSWDSSSEAPAAQRAREAAATPSLSMILWQHNRPVFPPALLSKFVEGSPHHGEVQKMKKTLEELWPADSAPESSTGGGPVRAVGSPDLSGVNMLDLERLVDLRTISSDSFAEEKLLCKAGVG